MGGTQMNEATRSQRLFGVLSKLMHFSGRESHYIMLGLFLFILANCSTLFSAYTLSLLVEKGLKPRDLHYTIAFAGIVCILESLYLLLFYLGKRNLSRSGLQTLFKIREALFVKLSRLPMRFFDQTAMGRIHVRIVHDVENIENFFTGSLPKIINAGLSMTLVCVGMLVTNWQLGSVMLLSIAPACLVTLLFSKPLKHWNHEYLKRNARVNARLAEFLSGIPVVRSLGLERWSHDYFREEAHGFLHAALQVNVLNSRARPIIAFLSMMPLLTLVFWGSHQVVEGALTLGLFVTFLRYSERFYRPLMVISQEIHAVQTAMTNMERVQSLLDEKEEMTSLPSSLAISRGHIAFKDLSMRYSEKAPWVLNRLSLEIQPGEKIGILGRTGSGKSSLVSLLARLYPFQEGELLIDGERVENYNLEHLRRSLGYVTQDIQLFRGTVRDNIRMGSDMSDEELLSICEQTGFSKVLKRHNLNLGDILPWGGEKLSHGEKQWLSLCRIYTRSPAIVVLDEPTSSLDPESEELFFKSFLKFAQNKTCLCIAHRLHTLEFCDRFLKIENGNAQWIERPEDLNRAPTLHQNNP
jgi:ATP-binding cassette subfamily B multidrug efflux pump